MNKTTVESKDCVVFRITNDQPHTFEAQDLMRKFSQWVDSAGIPVLNWEPGSVQLTVIVVEKAFAERVRDWLFEHV